MLSFLCSYALMILCGSIFICGFYIITRGKKVKQPDGTFRKEGMILKSWELFWDEIIGEKKIYYFGDNLEIKLNQFNAIHSIYRNNFKVATGRMSLEYTTPLTHSDELNLNTMFTAKVLVKDNLLFLYECEDIYRFPEWVRSPISACVYCMASVYGTIFYWCVLYLLKFGTSFHLDLKTKIFFWITFCISVSATNGFIIKHTKNN